MTITDHSLRYQLVNELHARPFPPLQAPSEAAYLAIKEESAAAARDRSKDFDHLVKLLDHYGAPHPESGANHYFGDLGKYRIRWESHSEFVSYTIYGDGVSETPFDGALFSVFPTEWLAEAPGARITSALIRIELIDENSDGYVAENVEDWFVSESLAVSRVLDNTAVVASDFRLDPAGHTRIAVFARPDTGVRRTGRIVTRLCEIETYKTLSMLGFTRVQQMSSDLGALDQRLTSMMGQMAGDVSNSEETLTSLLAISSELENVLALSSFRFGATQAYEALVHQRTQIMREERFGSRQTIAEFLMRRFDPAMRTVKATEDRLQTLSERSRRAGDLLRTMVDVERSAQNQKLLESMDRRADLQLRLQRTVEGLSVVAVSYYAVNLAVYILGPVGREVGLSGLVLTAVVTPVVVGLVWMLIRKIRKDAQ
ncbi:MAG: DUF3422 domain-containing protein [Pseudomonadota bacterium]